ncbi:MAG: hypothetical protein M1812_001411 [Candelaria pacifica]|nr:MAG: hypothetical protein M1812_001411 [Candelaria pacifica]
MASMQQPSASSDQCIWDPWRVLGLDPDDEEFTCVGLTESHSDRCRNRISRENRDEASSWLSELSQTSTLLAGDSDDLLFELASCVLCMRYHQGQADRFVKNWQRRIRAYGTRTARAVRTSRARRTQDSGELDDRYGDPFDGNTLSDVDSQSQSLQVINSPTDSQTSQHNLPRNDSPTPEDNDSPQDAVTSVATMIEQLSINSSNRTRLESAIRIEYIRAFETSNSPRPSLPRPQPQIGTIFSMHADRPSTPLANEPTSPNYSPPPPRQTPPTQEFIESEPCPICLEGLITSYPPQLLTCCIGNCWQTFHKDCILKWHGSLDVGGELGTTVNPTCPFW